MSEKKILGLDFDGVVHAYTSPWTRPELIEDGPVPGVREALEALAKDGWRVVLTTRRLVGHMMCEGITLYEGVAVVAAIKAWLRDRLGMVERQNVMGFEIEDTFLPVIVEMTGQKPDARVILDDRGLTFSGDWEKAVRDIRGFRCYRYGADAR